ncbi:hypothetical protein CVT26_009939 [Gymnopilus dilepis]|uniref:rRNA-processing protein n=1 Tax=Gymnopilus dilepis TaxID=231916 RepID=A0A409VLA1_9AGAR|nr:hypothetical protein CVT26_009939 [Gymnopilus dilepis]
MSLVPLASSANGRVSGKPWKAPKSATVYVISVPLRVPSSSRLPRRSQMPQGLRTKRWEDRMAKTQKAQAIKKLEVELKEEKQAELQRRREVTKERKLAAEEKRRLEEAKAQMGARKAARLRRKAGRTKKINH